MWLWVAIDPESKLVPCWHLGDRGTSSAFSFIHDLKGRLANRIQLTTDGHRVYVDAVDSAFGADVDYAMLVKIYGEPREKEATYSPAECMRPKSKSPTTGKAALPAARRNSRPKRDCPVLARHLDV